MCSGRLRLLLVEADDRDATLIADDLRMATTPFEVETVRTLRAAIDAVTTSSYDVLLVDLGLPDCNGPDTFRAVAAAAPSTPIVVLGGRTDDDQASREATRLGAHDHLPKAAIGTGLAGRVMQHAIERAEVERLRRVQGELFEALVASSLDAVRVVDTGGLITYARPGAGDHAVDDLIGRSNAEFVHHDDRGQYETACASLVEAGKGASTELTLQLRGTKGYRWMAVRLTNLLDHAGVDGIIVNARDITDRREFENRLRHQATHDALTGLPVRSVARDAIGAALSRGVTVDDFIAVLFLDLDRFKVVNDTRGHDIGDELLIAVAARIRSVLRGSDVLSRQGGDEFVVVAHDMHGIDDAMALAKRAQDALRPPVHVGDHVLYVTASVGIAVADDADQTPETVLSNADAAMYEAKRAGRDRVRVFDLPLENELHVQRDIEAELRTALDTDQLSISYQPILDVQTRTIRAVEALVRWEHPTRGVLSPADFIPVAEEAGLIGSIDRWILGQACEQVAAWTAQLGVRIGVNVNMSSTTAIDKGFPAYVDGVLRRCGMAAGSLCLELTETAFILYPTQAEANLIALRALGINVALDDFGTGFSSLTHLQKLPLTGIKIDRSFIAGLGIRASDTIIVRSTANLGRDLDLVVTAEGVENMDQLAILATFGCELAQGYMLDRPLAAEDLERRFLESDVRTTVWRSSLEAVGYDRSRR